MILFRYLSSKLTREVYKCHVFITITFKHAVDVSYLRKFLAIPLNKLNLKIMNKMIEKDHTTILIIYTLTRLTRLLNIFT